MLEGRENDFLREPGVGVDLIMSVIPRMSLPVGVGSERDKSSGVGSILGIKGSSFGSG